MSTNIEPFTKTTKQTITSFTVTCRTLNLFENAVFVVDSFDESKKFISRDLITLTNEQYNQWNNNDTFIINLVAEQLGYTIN
jgi:hypothetical protein